MKTVSVVLTKYTDRLSNFLYMFCGFGYRTFIFVMLEFCLSIIKYFKC